MAKDKHKNLLLLTPGTCCKSYQLIRHQPKQTHNKCGQRASFNLRAQESSPNLHEQITEDLMLNGYAGD